MNGLPSLSPRILDYSPFGLEKTHEIVQSSLRLRRTHRACLDERINIRKRVGLVLITDGQRRNCVNASQADGVTSSKTKHSKCVILPFTTPPTGHVNPPPLINAKPKTKRDLLTNVLVRLTLNHQVSQSKRS